MGLHAQASGPNPPTRPCPHVSEQPRQAGEVSLFRLHARSGSRSAPNDAAARESRRTTTRAPPPRHGTCEKGEAPLSLSIPCEIAPTYFPIYYYGPTASTPCQTSPPVRTCVLLLLIHSVPAAIRHGVSTTTMATLATSFRGTLTPIVDACCPARG